MVPLLANCGIIAISQSFQVAVQEKVLPCLEALKPISILVNPVLALLTPIRLHALFITVYPDLAKFSPI